MMKKQYTINLYNSITDIKKSTWDALVDENIYASHGWLSTVEKTFIGNLEYKYITVTSADKFLGAAPCYIFKNNQKVVTLDNQLLGRLETCMLKIGISFMPAFICGPVWGFGKHLITKDNLDAEERKTILKLLLSKIEEEAYDNNLSLVFIRVTDQEQELIKLLRIRKFIKANFHPHNFLKMKWASFDEYLYYLNTVTKGARKDIKRQINKNSKLGTSIYEVKVPQKYGDKLNNLVQSNSLKYGSLPFPFNEHFFVSLKDNLKDKVIIYVSEKNDFITGVCILLKANNIGYLPIVGVDHEMSGKDFTYFTLAYYRPIQDAIESGTDCLYFGLTHYELKARKGCRIESSYIFYKNKNPVKQSVVKLWFTILSYWNHHKIPKKIRKLNQI